MNFNAASVCEISFENPAISYTTNQITIPLDLSFTENPTISLYSRLECIYLHTSYATWPRYLGNLSWEKMKNFKNIVES